MLQVLSGEKELLERDDLPCQFPPQWPELSVQRVWQQLRDDDSVTKYFPQYDESECPPRKFFWPVFQKTHRELYRSMINDAIAQRASQNKKGATEEAIHIKSEWLEKLRRSQIVHSK